MHDIFLHKTPTFLLILPLLAMMSCTHVRTESWPDGTVKSSVTLKGKAYHGPASYYYEDGTPQLECSYRDNLLDGRLTRYYESGMKKEEMFYRQNKVEGPYTFWNRTGKIMVTAHFQDSLFHGPYTEYYPNGKLKIEGSYNKGLYDGTWFWYDEDGLIVGTAEFTAGSGIQKFYGPGGVIRQIVRYQNNLKEGPEETYESTGDSVVIKYYRKGDLVEMKKVKNIR